MQKAIFIPNFLRLFLTVIILMFTIIASAQSVAINNNGSTAHSSSMLDVTSTTKGLLIPRMSSGNRSSIASPAEGLLVYDTDTKGFWYYTNNAWTEMPKSINAGGAFSLPYSGSASLAGKVFSIANTNTTPGAFALHGQSGNLPSGIVPPFTSGVWGDNTDGPGIVGTSFNQNGILGIGVNDHGVKGISTFTGKAGVYGKNDAANSFGIMGEAFSSGAAVYGKATQANGKGGLFEITNTASTDTAVSIKHAGNGYGIQTTLTNPDNNHNAISAYNMGNGAGVMGQSINGNGGAFFKTSTSTSSSALYVANNGKGMGLEMILDNSNNLFPAANIGSLGLGNGIEVWLTNPSNQKDAVHAVNYGTAGNGVVSEVTSGKAGIFSNSNVNSNTSLFEITNVGNNRALIVTNEKTSNISPALEVNHAGMGSGLSINMTNASNNAGSGLRVYTNGKMGISVSATGDRGVDAYSAANSGIGVYGRTSNTSADAIGVKGESGVNGNNGIGVLGISGANDNNGIGVKGISTSTLQNQGAVTGINNSSGVGVYAQSTGLDGISLYGIAGSNSSNGKAALFRNVNPANIRTVVDITNAGTGNSLMINNTNVSAGDLVRLRNNGTGNFLLLEDGGASVVTTISKSGNITTDGFVSAGGNITTTGAISADGNISTDGTLTVKTNKGIVRSSTSTQLRYETIPAVVEALGGNLLVLCANCAMERTITFPTAFSSAPAISIANLLPGFVDVPYMFHLSIRNVTTTSCLLRIENPLSTERAFKATWNLVAVGAE